MSIFDFSAISPRHMSSSGLSTWFEGLSHSAPTYVYNTLAVTESIIIIIIIMFV